jgi:uncharacterized delta-60 repeat protein
MYINKKLFIHITFIVLIMISTSLSQNGQLDETFGNKGIVTTAINLDRSNSEALTTKIQSDGKIVTGGFCYNGNDYDFAVVRYNINGSMDNSFGTNGIVIAPVSSGDDEINSIVIQIDSADGNIEKIIACGFTQNINDTDFALVRFNPNGSIDSTFGENGNGIVTSGTNNLAVYATSAALQKDGKIVIAGYKFNGHDYDFMLARFSPDGIPDNNFGNANGIVTTEISGIGTNDRAYSVAIQNDGDIVAAGSSDEENSFAAARYKSNGSLDTSFAGKGIAITSVGSQGGDRNNVAFSIAIQEDDKIILGGRSYNENINDITLLRYKSNGEIDSTFNNNGIVITSLQNNSILGSIFIGHPEGGDEKIIAAGSSTNGSDLDITLARYNLDGKLDNSFGNEGIIIIPIAKSDQTAFSAAYQTDLSGGKVKKIITAGYFYDGTNIEFAVASFDGNGIVDKSFGTNGIVNTPVSNTHSILNTIAVQHEENGTEKIIAAGHTGKGNNSLMALIRYNPDGKPDSSFGTSANGIVTTSNSEPESIRSLIIQKDRKIIAVSHSTLARYNRDGIIDTLFGIKGIVNLPITATDETNNSAAIQQDGKILISGGFNNGSDFDFAVVRYDTSGNLDTNFGERGDGIAVTPIGTSTDIANSIGIQKDGKIVAVGDYRFSANKLDVVVIRYDTNGKLDNSFGTNGIAVTSIGSANDFAYSMAIQSDGKIIVAGASASSIDYDFSLIRYNQNGSVDSSFGKNGIVTTPIGNVDDIALSIALQITGGVDKKIVVAGKTFKGVYENFALATYNLDGSLDKTFGTNGIASMQIGTSSSYASSVLVQNDGKIVVGISSASTSADYSVFTLIRYNNNMATDVNEENPGKILTSFKLEQNYPNPFNPATKIRYSIPNSTETSSVQLKVYDMLGREVATLVNKKQQPGDYEISFNASLLATGVYFYRLSAGDFHIVKKMILMK